ncbi:l-asparaginase [Holotrichia oblita]|uniref:L-asparaginase n=1 Tax=Holotrichia oblita TaxID=644536 RepID=A0ACB9T9I6_HOLOL|nr:l-asparaginase [Holotrichia oblita]
MDFNILLILLLTLFINYCYCNRLVINTWGFTGATEEAWNTLVKTNDAIDTLEAGCSYCESHQCDFTVGYGGSPDESGETTLDALIFDGKTMNAGAVAALRRIKNAASVAKHVLQHTKHTLLAGDQATAFAVAMGFTEESLSTDASRGVWEDWKENNCQPNYWIAKPDPTISCGPYTPLPQNSIDYTQDNEIERIKNVEFNHDTIGMIVIDSDGNVAAGTSTNGLKHKIPGRVGDSPAPGAGAYADNAVGAACATGDGDVMMRFLPSFLAVEKMRDGLSPSAAAEVAITRIIESYPQFSGAVVAVTASGEFGAACNGMDEFPYSVRNDELNEVTVFTVKCI